VCVCVCVCVLHTHTHTHAHSTHAQTHTHTHTHTNSRTHTRTHTHHLFGEALSFRGVHMCSVCTHTHTHTICMWVIDHVLNIVSHLCLLFFCKQVKLPSQLTCVRTKRADKIGSAAQERHEYTTDSFEKMSSECDNDLKEMIRALLRRASPATHLPPTPVRHTAPTLPPQSTPASCPEAYTLECSGERRAAASWPWDAQNLEAWKRNEAQDMIMLERHRRAVNTSLNVAWCVCCVFPMDVSCAYVRVCARVRAWERRVG
jgi:hypothetical protein